MQPMSAMKHFVMDNNNPDTWFAFFCHAQFSQKDGDKQFYNNQCEQIRSCQLISQLTYLS